MVEAAMADTCGNKNKRFNIGAGKANGAGAGDGDDTEDEECDVEVWDTLRYSFKKAQAVLDQNRELIKKVNENHQSKIPDNLVKNVGLIREINGNISKVVEIYSGLSVNFSDTVRQRKKIGNRKISPAKSDDDDDGTYAIIMVHQFNAQHHPQLMVMFNLL
ncbi:Protein ELF4-LIKE 1 -like protein [Gossypium arboreum]|uniref:Protein ELF4-LIKE 1-like protein n=1 Tax=Gossypium arboreum TaxID=29729 RepID=A0A0B0NFJ1_GOSAR|nr:Protein ELF4-LIKE 1 -like protein [Gossypium arboreum]